MRTFYGMLIQEKFGSLLKKRIKEIQPVVEDVVGIDLGDVQVLPFQNYISKVVKDYKKKGIIPSVYTANELWFYFRLCEFILHPFAKAESSTIYYNTSPFSSLFPGRYAWNVGAHELGHVAHHRIINSAHLKSEEKVSEGFADYIAEHTLEKICKPATSITKMRARKFRALISKEGFPDSIEGAVSYLHFEHRRNEEKQKLYDSF